MPVIGPGDIRRIVLTAGEWWSHYGADDRDDILSTSQFLAIHQARQEYRAHLGDGDAENYKDPEDARYDSPDGQLAQAIAAALNAARELHATRPLYSTDTSAYTDLIAAMAPGMNRGQILAAIIFAGDDADHPVVQAARDAMMPHACDWCGTETAAPGREPEHFDWCPHHPDAVADAKRALVNRIIGAQPPGQQEVTEALLSDLLDLAEGNLSDRDRAELVARTQRGRAPREVRVAAALREVDLAQTEASLLGLSDVARGVPVTRDELNALRELASAVRAQRAVS